MTYSIRLLVDHRPVGPVVAEAADIAEIINLWQHGINAVCWNQPDKPIKRLPPQSLARVRALRHNRRIEAKVPLFAALFSVPVPPKPGK